MSAPSDASAGSIGLVLPADWVVVPLADEAERGRVVARLVDERIGGEEAHEALRRELRITLNNAARRAAAWGGWLLALMLTRVEGLPTPATLTGYRTAGSFRDEAGVAEVRAALEHATSAVGGSVDVGAGAFGVVLRTVREHTDTSGGALPRLACDYWTDPLDDHGLVHLSFSTPLVALRDEWCALFDTVVATLHRPEPPDDEDPVDVDEGVVDLGMPDAQTSASASATPAGL